jgi:hypothetical protein
MLNLMIFSVENERCIGETPTFAAEKYFIIVKV